MSFHSVDEIVEKLREVAKNWQEDILHGHGTVEDCVEEIKMIATQIEES